MKAGPGHLRPCKSPEARSPHTDEGRAAAARALSVVLTQLSLSGHLVGALGSPSQTLLEATSTVMLAHCRRLKHGVALPVNLPPGDGFLSSSDQFPLLFIP